MSVQNTRSWNRLIRTDFLALTIVGEDEAANDLKAPISEMGAEV